MKLLLSTLVLLFCALKAAECYLLPAGSASNGKQLAETTFECPSPDGLFPLYSSACLAGYYMCVDNAPYLQECPGNTVFDPSPRACQTIDKASCEVTTIHPTMPTMPTTVSPVKPFKCPAGDTDLFPKPGHCNQFISCSNGKAYTMYCPADLYYNPATKRCDYQWEVQCDVS